MTTATAILPTNQVQGPFRVSKSLIMQRRQLGTDPQVDRSTFNDVVESCASKPVDKAYAQLVSLKIMLTSCMLFRASPELSSSPPIIRGGGDENGEVCLTDLKYPLRTPLIDTASSLMGAMIQMRERDNEDLARELFNYYDMLGDLSDPSKCGNPSSLPLINRVVQLILTRLEGHITQTETHQLLAPLLKKR